MAGDWIKFELSTSDKPEVWQVAQELKLDPDAVVGKLLRIWGWFDQQTEKGNAPIVTKMLLDRNVGVTGFCDCMIKCGWLIQTDDTINIPNFDRHNGKTAKNRALTAKRVASHKEKSNAAGNAKVTMSALPKEEKSREEIKQDETPPASDPTLWDVWLSIPGVKAKGEPQARSHLGKLIRDYGEYAVAQAVAVVAVNKPAEPHSFLEGQLKANPKNGKRPAWALIPREDNDLWPWAKIHNYPNPGSQDYRQYRQTLQRCVEKRLNEEAA